MTYLWIFGSCYLAALAIVLTMYKNKNDIAANRLRDNGVTDDGIRNFYRQLHRKSLLPLTWAIFVFGSVGGAILSTVYLVAQ
jgi:hypothetical protein